MDNNAYLLKAQRLFQTNPLLKTFGFAVSVILSGVLSSALVSEMTVNGSVDWSLFFSTRTFIFLLIYLFLVFLYNLFLYSIDVRIQNFMDKDYQDAYILFQCMPDLIEQFHKDIKAGKRLKGVSSFKKQMEELRK